MDYNSLSHTKWNCNYHVVFAPKYRRQAIYGKIKEEIGQILRKLCEQKGIEIIEAHAMPDHIHMLVSIPPKLAVADFMGYGTVLCGTRISVLGSHLQSPSGDRDYYCLCTAVVYDKDTISSSTVGGNAFFSVRCGRYGIWCAVLLCR